MTREDVIEAMARGIENASWMTTTEFYKATRREEAEAALSALESLGIALVPVEPTEEMVRAPDRIGSFTAKRCYRDMIDASPLRKTEGGEE